MKKYPVAKFTILINCVHLLADGSYKFLYIVWYIIYLGYNYYILTYYTLLSIDCAQKSMRAVQNNQQQQGMLPLSTRNKHWGAIRQKYLADLMQTVRDLQFNNHSYQDKSKKSAKVCKLCSLSQQCFEYDYNCLKYYESYCDRHEVEVVEQAAFLLAKYPGSFQQLIQRTIKWEEIPINVIYRYIRMLLKLCLEMDNIRQDQILAQILQENIMSNSLVSAMLMGDLQAIIYCKLNNQEEYGSQFGNYAIFSNILQQLKILLLKLFPIASLKIYPRQLPSILHKISLKQDSQSTTSELINLTYEIFIKINQNCNNNSKNQYKMQQQQYQHTNNNIWLTIGQLVIGFLFKIPFRDLSAENIENILKIVIGCLRYEGLEVGIFLNWVNNQVKYNYRKQMQEIIRYAIDQVNCMLFGCQIVMLNESFIVSKEGIEYRRQQDQQQWMQ